MDRTNGAGHVGHMFVAEDVPTNRPPTEVTEDWLNTIQEELAALPEGVGMTLDPNNRAQVREAIQRMIDAQSGNYALDTGAANAYVVALSPAITVYTDGLTVRVKAVNANTGACSLNAGGGVVTLLNDAGGALVNGDIPAGSIFTATYITSANKFYITSMVQSQGDARYVGLTGNQSIAGKKTFSDTTDATSSTDAGTMVSGGMGVAKKMIAGISMEAPYARSVGGNTSALNNTFTSLFTATVGMYLIYMRLGGAGSIYLAEGIACFDSAAGLMLQTANGSNAALQISGMDVQGKQLSGGTATINWVAIKIL